MSFSRKSIKFITAALIMTSTAVVFSEEKDKVSYASQADMASLIADLQAQVSALYEKEKVREVYVNYGRGIDRLDEEAYRKSFWPDGQINYGTLESITPEQHWQNHMIKGFKAQLKSWGHNFTNQVIDIDGDVAHVETYLTVMAIPKGKDSFVENMNVWSGRYIDKLERRHGEWRISVREYMPYFTMKADIANNAAIYDGYFSGAKSSCIHQADGKNDVAYARPLRKRERGAGPACGE